MTKDEALKLALEALERGETELRWKAINAIREALAQPGQEPVAWMNKHGACISAVFKEVDATGGEYTTPLYTTPPHRKPLSDEEIWKVVDQCKGGRIDFARAIEAAHGIKE